ncbi:MULTISPECIES: hypothetical protein [unclassified Aurantimonas]|uniref:hypothetical protein n=1 Tax=unclassified Aurantimonas TaxID=2638230 RepID=UPI002E1872DD|nr:MULTISPECIES: hypothetical protein [unclassified Aurantimonas]MEC5289406.1 hypothetical protein [Aurantimonas sp. C2-3-R2]MEC5410486.1 hypothetical protein [Aurantimonas sp. C2-4-R8]
MTSRPKGRLDALLDGLGIRLIPTKKRRRPGDSHARGACHHIRNEYGDGHLVFVLKCMTQTGQRDALWSETILALSDVLLQCPQWAERASDLFDALDGIELNKLRRRAVLRRPWPVRHTLRGYLDMELSERMDARVDQDLFGEEAA